MLACLFHLLKINSEIKTSILSSVVCATSLPSATGY